MAIEIEKVLICSLLVSGKAMDTGVAELRPEMFENPDLGFVFQCIREVYNRGIQPDFMMIELEMRKTDEERFTRLNGLSFLLDYVRNIRYEANTETYIAEVRRRFQLRSLKSLFEQMSLKVTEASAQPEQITDALEQHLARFYEQSLTDEPLQPLEVLAVEAVEWQRLRRSGDGRVIQIASGLEEFDYVTGGFHKGELTILGGRPSDGKTAVALQMALNIARQGHPVCFFSLEMSSLQILNRVLTGMTGINPDCLRVELPTDREMAELERAVGLLKGLPFYLDYTAGSSLDAIRTKAMMQRRKGKCAMIVIDYLHLLGGAVGKGETTEQVVSRHVQGLKRLALQLDCPILALSQMNRACETRTERGGIPVMSDLRDSGTIEQIADCVTFAHRPERHGILEDEKGNSLKGVGRLYVLKNRNGATGLARFRYNESFTIITNYRQKDRQTRLDL